ncbi:AAA family ATPase [Brucella intermedia]|uniref:AAA family ATPase n=1 Tax=Brucella intermedia TaxID=94625 RepID=UPI0034CE7DD4
MLTQIEKIKNIGVFDNYIATADSVGFDRFNVIFGENGSGKTTLSRLLGSLQLGGHSDFPTLEFTVETQQGTLTQGRKYARNVRVFNSDFVESNLGRFEAPFRHILILGEENRAVAEEIRSEIATRDARQQRIREQSAEAEKLVTEKGKIFSKIAQTIGEATSGSVLRTYRKPDAEKAFQKLGDVKSLQESELEIHRMTIRQEQMSEVGPLPVPEVGTGERISVLKAAYEVSKRCLRLTSRSAQSAIITRLADNPSIATWVEDGLFLHKSHTSTNCEFCNQTLPTGRIKILANHFSIEDQKLKGEIEDERRWIAAIVETLDRFSWPDRLALYPELRSDYDVAMRQLRNEIESLKMRLRSTDDALAEKLMKRTESYEINVNSDISDVETALLRVTDIVTRHDNKTKSFDIERNAAREAIEAHYLLTIREQLAEIEGKIEALRISTELLKNGGQELADQRSLEDIEQSIINKQALISNEHKGGEELTKHLRQFLGRTDLTIENSAEGYILFRRGKPARRLSEGEKTAIAFLYFLVQLKDRDFDLAEGVVVIDDPISSLDSAAIYQAFSFLKNETQNARQLFILTHNYEFLRLVLNWFQNMPSKLRKQCSYSMVLCSETENGRSARLAPLDKLLIEHATEYHYLFKVLHTFQSDGTILSCYHVPNTARKVLETFLDFYLPSNKSLYQKLEDLKFDPHKKTAIYKFANDLSHFTGKGFDPALVTETQKNTAYLLEMIETVAPSHYNGLRALAIS